jgi:hypothetical protein
MYQRCWLLCTSYDEYKGARKYEDLESRAPPELFYSTQRTAMSENNIVLQNTVHYYTRKPTFPYVKHMVYCRKQCSPFMAP